MPLQPTNGHIFARRNLLPHLTHEDRSERYPPGLRNATARTRRGQDFHLAMFEETLSLSRSMATIEKDKYIPIGIQDVRLKCEPSKCWSTISFAGTLLASLHFGVVKTYALHSGYPAVPSAVLSPCPA
jgi:hypothetical protein